MTSVSFVQLTSGNAINLITMILYLAHTIRKSSTNDQAYMAPVI